MYFFATTTDIEQLVAYMIGELDFNMYEAYSQFNKPIRQIWAETKLSDFESRSGSVLLRGWRQRFNSPPEFTKIKTADSLRPQVRIELEGPAVFQVHSGHKMENGALFPSYLNHWDRPGIEKLEVYSDDILDSVNWDEVTRISEDLRQYANRTAAMASLSGMPILPDALKLMQVGIVNFWDFEQIISKNSRLVDLHKAA